MTPSFHKPAGAPPAPAKPAFSPPAGEAAPAKPKRKKGTSPTARSLAELRELGFTAGVVEKPWNPHIKRTQDFLGIIDIIAVMPGVGVLGIQATGSQAGTSEGGHHASRRKKALDEPRLRPWLESGARFEIWSWNKRGERGVAKLWRVRRDEITLEDLGADSKAGLFAGAPT